MQYLGHRRVDRRAQIQRRKQVGFASLRLCFEGGARKQFGKEHADRRGGQCRVDRDRQVLLGRALALPEEDGVDGEDGEHGRKHDVEALVCVIVLARMVKPDAEQRVRHQKVGAKLCSLGTENQRKKDNKNTRCKQKSDIDKMQQKIIKLKFVLMAFSDNIESAQSSKVDSKPTAISYPLSEQRPNARIAQPPERRRTLVVALHIRQICHAVRKQRGGRQRRRREGVVRKGAQGSVQPGER
jgi:hypothetical protein